AGPELRDDRIVDDGGINASNGVDRHADLAAKRLQVVVHLVSGAGGIPDTLPVLADGVAAEARLFLEQKKIFIPEEIRGEQSAGAAADYHVVMRADGRSLKSVAVANAVANVVTLAAKLHIGRSAGHGKRWNRA